MNKLREKFENWYNSEPISKENEVTTLEQITDDFSVKLIEWCRNIMFTLNHEHQNKTPLELQQYFKNNIYGKE